MTQYQPQSPQVPWPPVNAAFWPGLQPPRKSWARRHEKGLAVLGALAVIVIVSFVFGHKSSQAPTYRDPATLSKSLTTEVSGQLHKAGSQATVTEDVCELEQGNDYQCVATLSDGSSKGYRVTVAADGSSWVADGS